jgi:hypothetical protein
MEVVLQWCTGDQQSVLGIEGSDNLRQHGVFILDTMGFINNDVLP